MSGKIPENKIQEVMRANDIRDVTGRYLELKRTGKSFKALCPFHDEKTPSFSVDPRKQLFHCFGCKESGNVIQFVQKIEGIHFLEAVRKLASWGGVDVSIDDDEPSGERTRIFEANSWARDYFKNKLWKSDRGEEARSYIKDRGFTKETTLGWDLGLAPEEWENLLDAGREQNFSEEELNKAGLVIESSKGTGYYDRFRNRLMFPIRDYQGRTVGFGGRILPDAGDGDQPKYMNSPESPVFQKRKLLFGWSRADRRQVNEIGLWIAEGYTDVIMAHQYGLRNVVATLGTALGEKHVKNMRSRVEEVVLMFDADQAGQKASERSLRLFLEEDITIRICELPPDEDPCSILESDGKEGLKNIVDDAKDLIEFRLESAREKHDLSTVDGKMNAAKEVLETVRGLDNSMRKQLIVKHIAEMLGVDESSVRSTLHRMERTGGGFTNNTSEPAQENSNVSRRETALERAMEKIIGALVTYPERSRYVIDVLEEEDVPLGKYKELYGFIADRIRKDGKATVSELLTLVNDEEKKDLLLEISLDMDTVKEEDVGRLLEESLEYLKTHSKKSRVTELKKELKEAYSEGDRNRYRKLLDRVSSIQKSMHDIKTDE